MKRMKHIISMFLVLVLLIGCTGCKQKSGSASETAPKGRYLEHDLEFPEYSEGESYVDMTSTRDGLPILYTYTLDSDKLSVTTYTYKADGTFTKEEPEWLKGIELTPDSEPMLCLCAGPDNSEYLLVSELIDSKYVHGTLYKTTDQTSRTKVEMKDWDKQTEDGSYKLSPTKIGVLDNGNIVVNSYDGLYLYNANGEQIYAIDENYVYTSFMVQGNNILCYINDSGTEMFKGVDVYDGTAIEKAPVESRFDTDDEYTEAVNYTPSGDIIFVNSTGICRQKAGTDLWQTVVDGSLGTMLIPYVTGMFISADANDNYYVMYYDYSTGVYSFIQYSYDLDVNTVPSQELTVYTLSANNTLKKTAYEFQKTHPDVKVTIEVAMQFDEKEGPSEGGLTKHDYIQSLNTQLLAGDGCDIINLTDLPLDAYIEKGVLLDVSDVTDSLQDKLLMNVINACKTEDHLYYIPGRILIPVMISKPDILNNLTSIAGLADYAQNNTDSTMLGHYTAEDLIDTFLPYAIPELTSNKGSIDSDALTAFLENMKAIGVQTGLVDTYSETCCKSFPYDLINSLEMCLISLNGIGEATHEFAFSNYATDDYDVFEECFTTSVQAGINVATKQPELAKEFLATMLNEDVQSADLEDGFPILKSGLDESNYEVDETLQYPKEDGSTANIELRTLTDEEKSKLLSKIESLTKISRSDDTILEAVTENFITYYNGKQTLDETVAAIQNKLSLYNAE